MNSVRAEYIRANRVIEEFVEQSDKFKERYVSLLEDMDTFIRASGMNDEVVVNELSLGYALLDYFEDIRRLKQFHNVDHVNSVKIVAYISYWLLRRKPIQLKETAHKQALYINEKFVLAYILAFLSGTNKTHILDRSLDGLDAFAESLLYHLKYRAISSNSIEQIITAFFAGQIYQEKEKDLSSELGKCDEYNEDE